MWFRVNSHRILLALLAFLSVMFARPADSSDALAVRTGLITVEGGALFFEQSGQGASMVLIHDGLLHRDTWDAQLATLAERFSVVRYDRRGYGRSTPAEAPYSGSDDLLAVCDSLDLEKPWLMGCSAGARLAIEFAITHPDRVEGLILVGPVVGGMNFTTHGTTRGGRIAPDAARNPAALGDYWFTDDPYTMATGHEEARSLGARLLQENPQNLDPRNGRMMGIMTDAVSRLGQITVPALIVVGEYDLPDVHAHAGAIEAGIAGAQRTVLPGTGHLAHMEDPAAFNRVVLDFLASSEFSRVLVAEGAVAAESTYRAARTRDPHVVTFEEARMNAVGYEYLQRGQVDDAIILFSLNTEVYPDSWNVWDSLGEAYLNAGDRLQAVECYQKSLQLNPGNENGRTQLAQMDRLIAEFGNETRERSRFAPGETTGLHGPYLGQSPPGTEPKVFAPGIISTRGEFEFSCTFSPDGSECYFNRSADIMWCRLTPDGWSAPEPAPFSTPFLDHEAHITADGNRLLFGSGRPRPGVESNPYGIWVMNRRDGGWTDPEFHGPGMYVTSSRAGDLYLTGMWGGEEILVRQRLTGDSYGPPEPFPSADSPFRGAHPCIAWDESFVVFDTYRPDTSDAAPVEDFFIAFKQNDGSWGRPVMIPFLSTPGADMCASLSPDGRFLFYHTSRDIHWISVDALAGLRPPSTGSRAP